MISWRVVPSLVEFEMKQLFAAPLAAALVPGKPRVPKS